MALAILVANTALGHPLPPGRESPIDRMINGVVCIDGIFFGLTGVAYFVLRKRLGGEGAAPMRGAGYPVAPILFVMGELAIVAGSFLSRETRVAALLGLGWIGVAVVLYLVRFRNVA